MKKFEITVFTSACVIAILLRGIGIAEAAPNCKNSDLVAGQVLPELDVISVAQYELLRNILLAGDGRLTQKWGEFNKVNLSSECLQGV